MQKATSGALDLLLKWVVLPFILFTVLIGLASGGTISSLLGQATSALLGLETPFRIALAALGGFFFLVGAAHLIWPSKHQHAGAQMTGSAALIVVAWLFPELMTLLATLANTFGPLALGSVQSAASSHAAGSGSVPTGGTMPLPH